MELTNQERLIRTIIVTNEKRVDVFRIHVFEKSIKFDSHFAYGVSKNDSVYEMVMNIERMWSERKIELSDIFNMMVGVIEKHEGYLQQFYFKPDELDLSGRLNVVRPYSVFDDKNYMYFMFNKNKDNLKNISREEFESNIKDEEVVQSYVDNYSPNNTKFFNYRLSGLRNSGKNCYLMMVHNNLKIGFVKS